MSEAATRREPCGAPVGGHVGGQPACKSCGHPHRRYLDEHLVFDAACGCGCVASREAYDRGVVDTADVATFVSHVGIDPNRQPAEPRAIYDDDDEYCGSISIPREHDDDGPYAGPRCLPDVGHGDAGRTRGLDARGGLRGGGLGGFVWSCVSRLLGDFCGQLVSERGVESSGGRRPGVAGLADHGGGTDSAESTGSERLRRVVSA